MRILVAVKAVADFSMLAEQDWQNAEDGRVDVSFTRSALNCFDESAAELALMLRDTQPDTQLTALTVNGDTADYALKPLMAQGFREVVRVGMAADEDLRFHPQAIACLIAGYHLRVAAQDVMLLGEQSPEGHNAQTAPLLAELLNWPCLTQVTQLEYAGDGLLRVFQQKEAGLRVITARPPLVLAAGNAAQAGVLRVPTLKQKLAAGQKSITHLSPDALLPVQNVPPETEPPRLLRLSRRRNRRTGVLIDGASAQEKARRLYHDYLKERLAK